VTKQTHEQKIVDALTANDVKSDTLAALLTETAAAHGRSDTITRSEGGAPGDSG
jgi:hypothetical protein